MIKYGKKIKVLQKAFKRKLMKIWKLITDFWKKLQKINKNKNKFMNKTQVILKIRWRKLKNIKILIYQNNKI